MDFLPSWYSALCYVDVVTRLFGDHFQPEHLQSGVFPAWTTVPIFLARGLERSDDLSNGGSSSNNEKTQSNIQTEKRIVRTDLHCEPIANIAVQLTGEKRWTLIDPAYTNYLKPSVSREGRAYFFSNVNPLDPAALEDIPHYEVITKTGDALWVPPWAWHRVDYIPGVVSFAASLFHFRPMEFFRNNPLFATLILPNLVKELLGRKAT